MTQSIRNIQQQLQDNGYFNGGVNPVKNHVDGAWGPNSQKALEAAIRSKQYKMDFDFATFKKEFNRKSITQTFVNSINHLFDAFNEYNEEGGTNPLNIAYMLATSWLETAYTMSAIKEYGGPTYFAKYGRGNLAKILGNKSVEDGIKYAGRGHVMITGRSNYQKFTNILGVDLIGNPDLALDSKISAKILTIGSLRGIFTGRSLSDYIKYGHRKEFIDARRVINGVDRNKDIADYAQKFLKCVLLKKVDQ